ncbi:MAG: phosphoribosylformylglycinamidine synthase [Omnitrophica bacterium RIFCSPHIGHO2_02_FULL_46_11]|nr:MAG: phosphoribosylformylglycinamidine synthase [Omnitrophica bacterium RIFCSPHIGHO2_02_FULL_46_11]OGW86764.1 MAG: phosphoribosylformylglycinamidine synthase [Omnitrophica bacterium RIFCSPLOWO2_01_FULL_45_10b]
MFKAKVDVTLKKSVLDPQGQTVLQALHSLGFKHVEGLRVGKHFELMLHSSNRAKAESDIKVMCDRLLINPIIEEYSFQLEEVK